MPYLLHEWLKSRAPSFQPLRNNRTIPTCAYFLCLPCNHTYLNRVIGLSLQFRYLKLIWNNLTCFCFVPLSRNPLNCVCINFKDAKTAKKVLLSHIKTRNEYFVRLYFFKNYCFIFIFVTLLNKTFPGDCLRYFFLIRVIFYFQKKVFEMYISIFLIWNHFLVLRHWAVISFCGLICT